MARGALGQLVTFPGAGSVSPCSSVQARPQLQRDTAELSATQDKPRVAKAKCLRGWLQP